MAKAEAHKGAKLYVCATAQGSELTKSAFEALTWVQVKKVGSVSGIGTNQNPISYSTLDDPVTQKAKGTIDGGNWTVECAVIYDDPGQVALRTVAGTDLQYAFKYEYADSPDGVKTNTIVYNRGIVMGPTRPGGRADDFVLEQFTLGMNQENIFVLPA